MELIQDAQNKQQVQDVLKLVALLPIIWVNETDCARALSDFTTYHEYLVPFKKLGNIAATIADDFV